MKSGCDLEESYANMPSPMKFDKQLEEIMNEQNGKNQNDDLDYLMMNIEKENRINHQSPDPMQNKTKTKKLKRHNNETDATGEFLTLDDIAR